MPAPSAFEYAVVRLVPRVEREEFINAGVILFCDVEGFLDARVGFDEARLLALAPNVDVALVREHLMTIPVVCKGGSPAGSIGAMSTRERWHWLTAARSTVVQTSPAHAGLSPEPEATLVRLFDTLVR